MQRRTAAAKRDAAPSRSLPDTHTHSEPPDHPHAASSHSHSHSADDGHSHSHGIFSTHHHDHTEGAEQLITALRSGRLDRGTKVTLLGLGSNVVLTAGKGLAGLWMNSASLLAEAGHSLSDLLGVSADFSDDCMVPKLFCAVHRIPAASSLPGPTVHILVLQILDSLARPSLT